MSSRWLIITGSIVAVLIIVGVVVAISTQKKVPLLADDTPEGTVQRYLQALEKEDYAQAYSYLSSDIKAKKTYQEFHRDLVFPNIKEIEQRQITLEKAKVSDSTAEVVISISEFQPSGPLTFRPSEHSFPATFFLQKEGGKWYISDATWPTWLRVKELPTPVPAVPAK